jgi:hypothetical protein
VLNIETAALAGVAKAAARVAALVGADWRDVVPIVNATAGVNAVVGSVELRPGDLLMMTNATYPAVRPRFGPAVSVLSVCSPARHPELCSKRPLLKPPPIHAHPRPLPGPPTINQVRSTLARAAARAGAALLEVVLPWDGVGSDNVILSAFASALAEHHDGSSRGGRRRRVRLAVLDHVISFPPVVMPVAKLCAMLGCVGLAVGRHL